MKWLPPPSVPSWPPTLWDGIFGCLSRMRSSRTSRSELRQRETTESGVILCSPPPPTPTGILRSISERSFASESGSCVRRQRRLHRHHPATDVDADSGRNDRALGRDHRANGRAASEVDVGHDGEVGVHERQSRHVFELGLRGVLERNALHPGLDTAPVGRFEHFKRAHVCGLSLSQTLRASRSLVKTGQEKTLRRHARRASVKPAMLASEPYPSMRSLPHSIGCATAAVELS